MSRARGHGGGRMSWRERLLWALLGAFVVASAYATTARADTLVDADVQAWADELDLDPLDLQGAVSTTGLDVEAYLVGVGHLAPPAPPPAAAYGGCPALIVETFGPTWQKACAVAWCESRWVATAKGRLGERGYFQIHPVHGDYSDPPRNVAFAYQLSAGGTFWTGAWKVCGA